MRATLTKRAVAWFVDLFIVCLLFFLIGLVYHPDVSFFESNIDLLTVSYAEGDISFEQYVFLVSGFYKQIDVANIGVNIINLIVLIGYFVFLPYYNNGMTIGKKIKNIEVKSQSNQELSLWQLLVRNMIINGLFYLIMIVICTLVIKDSLYFVIITCLGILQAIFILISVFMAFYRKDHKALHDIISKTWVACFK